MSRRLAQQRMALSDLECLKSISFASRAISAVAELFVTQPVQRKMAVLTDMMRRIEDDYEVDDITTLPFFPYCHEATHPLTDGWRLFYFETHRWHYQKQTRINASQPFRKAYTSPMPKYMSTISVCDNEAVRRCHADRRQDSDECPDDE